MIKTVRGSGKLEVIGLAHQVIEPDVALPEALTTALLEAELDDDEDEELDPQAAKPNAAADKATSAAACRMRRRRVEVRGNGHVVDWFTATSLRLLIDVPVRVGNTAIGRWHWPRNRRYLC